jgi:type VI secretion system protein ImpE
MRVTDTKAAQSDLIAKLRARPDDTHARLQLFRLAVIDGNWGRASNQLEIAAAIDASLSHTTLVYERNIDCERTRNAVFLGRESPVFLGAPPAWSGYLVQSLQQQDADAGAMLATTALEQAEAAGGTINGEPFAWIADGDSRLGPTLEAFIDGEYYWVPYEHLDAIRLNEPDDVLDLAWCPCSLTLKNGGESKAYIPTRYPDTERSGRDDLKLARMTEWQPWSATLQKGLGQRTFITDSNEYALLDCREILFASRTGNAAA